MLLYIKKIVLHTNVEQNVINDARYEKERKNLIYH
jgi:hypothetical protein